MIDDPPLLQVRRQFERPPRHELAALAGLQTGYIADALGGRGALDHRIKPLVHSGGTLVGVALTCHCGPGDNLALFGALHAAEAGDVLVAAADGFTHTAVAGDLMIGMARNRGVAGLVTDGMVRDIAGLRAVGLPVFCAGVTPNSPARNGPGHVGLPVVVGGVQVASGDVVVGDEDGVVVIPRSRIAAVLARLPAIRAAESSLEEKVKAGLEVPDFFERILASGRVQDIL
jgi:4-hydroxy-4-methyl-2-oxoglutarate aldolase